MELSEKARRGRREAVHAADGSGIRHYVDGDAFDGRFVDGTFEALPGGPPTKKLKLDEAPATSGILLLEQKCIPII